MDHVEVKINFWSLVTENESVEPYFGMKTVVVTSDLEDGVRSWSYLFDIPVPIFRIYLIRLEHPFNPAGKIVQSWVPQDCYPSFRQVAGIGPQLNTRCNTSPISHTHLVVTPSDILLWLIRQASILKFLSNLFNSTGLRTVRHFWRSASDRATKSSR